jgi:uncharacterized SAM-binding protein YcdF (DUF218 family)
MQPDIIAVLQGGIVEGPVGLQSATYEHRDAFGTLGGRARVEAAAILAKQFSQAKVLATDAVNAGELHALGVSPERLMLIELEKHTTLAALQVIASHAQGNVSIVSNEYHLPRIAAFLEMIKAPAVQFISAESVLAEADPTFQKTFDEVKQTAPYQERLAAEARGIEAIKAGNYNSVKQADKQERSV